MEQTKGFFFSLTAAMCLVKLFFRPLLYRYVWIQRAQRGLFLFMYNRNVLKYSNHQSVHICIDTKSIQRAFSFHAQQQYVYLNPQSVHICMDTKRKESAFSFHAKQQCLQLNCSFDHQIFRTYSCSEKYYKISEFARLQTMVISNIICMVFDAVVVFGLRFLTFYQNWFDHTVIFRTQKRALHFSDKKSYKNRS